MPFTTPNKSRGSVVRQLSLQSSTPLTSPNRQKLKKQFSEDDGRSLESVEVTGQGWASPGELDPIVRNGLADGKLGHSKISSSRPKPAKVAWIDKKQETAEYPKGVEIVATKCQGQPRPLSNKMQRFRNPLLGNKSTLVYTRCQLAERLRNAWSERDKTKPNLNIFLAHASEALHNQNQDSDRQLDNASTLSDITETKLRPVEIRTFSEDIYTTELLQKKLEIPSFEIELQKKYLNEEKDKNLLDNDVENFQEDDNEKAVEEVPRLQELNKIEIRVTKNEETFIVSSGDKENLDTSVVISEPFEKNEQDKEVQPVAMSAKDRRGNFRNSNIHFKTITDSFSFEEEKPYDLNDNLKKLNQKKVLVRALSAPSHDQSFQKQSPQTKTVKFLPQKHLQSIGIYDATEVSPDEIIAIRERIKSAPIKRKLKTAAARRKSKAKAESSSDEEKETKESTTNKKGTRRSRLKSGNDIVTMVSLVSPAESDIEDSVINLPLESLSTEEDKKETVSQAKPSKDQEILNTSFVVQKLVSLRKATKTVSFQQNPVATRSYSSSFPSRRAPAGTPIIIPSPVISNPALTPAQIQERDKRPPFYSGVDGRGVKRRLMRSPSEPTKDNAVYENDQKPLSTSPLLGNDFTKTSDKFCENETVKDSENDEPEFKSLKEKECWSLYKKMVANGVVVSFDTVLRGMLTPTEYRLRKNPLLLTC